MKINLLFFFYRFFSLQQEKTIQQETNSTNNQHSFFFTLNLKYTLNDFDHKKTKFKVYLSFGTFCPHF